MNSSIPPIAGHPVELDDLGHWVPWTPWSAALRLEMDFYQTCPSDHGYPRFAHATFLDADWNLALDRTDSIPATQNGMGIVSYLKYHEHLGGRDPRFLRTARALGDYLTLETLTPLSGRYPGFTRSTGRRDQFPLVEGCGSQSDRPDEIEPDKGGIAGHALWSLYLATGEERYAGQALHNARVLAANQREGDESRSPWPFRVDHRTGEGRGMVSGNMTYILRLYDALIARGHDEFVRPRAALWDWIKGCQIPSAAGDGGLFAQFFEDHDTPTNRTAWSPLNLARYLLERRETIDADWRGDARALIDFVRRTFTHEELGVVVCHEQDEDKNAWGGINSTYGAVLAMYARAANDDALALEARRVLDFTVYSIDARGCPRDLYSHDASGGWQEDAHTDVIHNYVDAMRAFPAWCSRGRRE